MTLKDAISHFVDYLPLIILIAFNIKRFFPSITSGSVGVLFVGGKVSKLNQPGQAVINLPPFITTKMVRVLTAICNLPPQKVVVKDGTVWKIDAGFSYQVDKPVAAVTCVDNFEKAIVVIGAMIITQVISQADRTELKDLTLFNDRIKSELGTKLVNWGIRVENIWITSVSATEDSANVIQFQSSMREKLQLLNSTNKLSLM